MYRARSTPELLLSRLHEVRVEGSRHCQPHCHPGLEVLRHLLNGLQATMTCIIAATRPAIMTEEHSLQSQARDDDAQSRMPKGRA